MPDAPPPSPIEPFRPLPDPSWRERAEGWLDRARSASGRVRLAATAVAAMVAVAVGILALRPATTDARVEDALPRASSAASGQSDAEEPAPSSVLTIVVQAAGAVVQPGVYRLPPDARVDDLIRAAGGLVADADADRVNLAARLTDGVRVYVPRIGEVVPPDLAAEGSALGSSGEPRLVDLNSASIAELDTLPGIGPATAQAIVDYRTQHGRFSSVDDLLNVRGIGPAKLEEIRALVRV